MSAPQSQREDGPDGTPRVRRAGRRKPPDTESQRQDSAGGMPANQPAESSPVRPELLGDDYLFGGVSVSSEERDTLYCYWPADNGGDTLFGDSCLEPYDPALPADEKPSASVRPQPKQDEPQINSDLH